MFHIMYKPFTVLFCYLTADNGDDDNKELDDDYYNKVTGRKHVKVNDFNNCCTYFSNIILQKPPSMDVHKKASLLPAMEVAHPGASYNPSFVDHQVMLYAVISKCQFITFEGCLQSSKL